MPKSEVHTRRTLVASALFASALFASACTAAGGANNGGRAQSVTANRTPSCSAPVFTLAEARPLVSKYCVTCHSPDGEAGPDYDFRSEGALNAHRRGIEAKLRLGTMPPPGAPHPSDAERSVLWCWARG